MKVVIVTPGHIASNPRAAKEAERLALAGNDVTVISTFSLSWLEEAERSIIEAASWRSERVAYRSKLAWWSRRLVQISWRAAYRRKIAADPRGALSPVTASLARRAKKRPADLYIAHYPAALPAAAEAAHRNNALYAYDAEDFHLGDLPDLPHHDFERGLIHAIESRYLPGCAYMTAASPGIADAYADAYGIAAPTVVLNVFPKANAPAAPTPSGVCRPGPSLYWFSQTIGPGRGLECAVDAIASAKSAPHLYLRGHPATGYVDVLMARAATAKVADRVHILGPVPPSDLERAGAEFDIGYVGELAETQNRQVALTNKLFSYLTSGIPIVASDIPAHRHLRPEFGEAMLLFATNDPASLGQAIDCYLLDPGRLAVARREAWRLGQEKFSWDLHARYLLEMVDKAFSNLPMTGNYGLSSAGDRPSVSVPSNDFR